MQRDALRRENYIVNLLHNQKAPPDYFSRGHVSRNTWWANQPHPPLLFYTLINLIKNYSTKRNIYM